MCRSTGQAVEGGGEGTDADPFGGVKHPERMGRRFGVGGKRDWAGQYGRRGVSREKMMDRIYTRGLDGYRFVAMLGPSQHCNGVVLFYRESTIFVVEVIRQFGANVITCQLATGERRWFIFGCYLAPGYRATIRDVKTAINKQSRGTELIVAGYINVDLEKTGGRFRYKDIAAVVVTAGLEDLSGYFLP